MAEVTAAAMDLEARKRRLAAYLKQVAARPFSFETQHDCCLGLIAGWIHVEAGLVVGAEFRGRYATAIGCARLIVEAGGLVPIFERGLGAHGLAQTDAPQLGDVAIVMAETTEGPGEAAAIRTGIGWAGMTQTGVVVMQGTAVAAWGVPWGGAP